jgi:basic membrane protein A
VYKGLVGKRWAVLAGLLVLNGALLVAGAKNRRKPELGQGMAGGEGPKSLKKDGPEVRVGLVFDIGGLGDKSFNDAAYRGLERAAAELNVRSRYVEPADGSDRESALRQLAAEGYDLVIGVGFIFTDDMRALATRFPDVKFACVDYAVVPGAPPPPANLVALRFREEEGAFLVGALAGLVSETKKVGFVGGMQIPLIEKFEKGYAAGVREVCPTCKVYVAYAGSEPSAFADPVRGKELALAQYGQGADIIFHASGKTGAGVFAAARERGKLVIGVDSDQRGEAPGFVLTSMVKGVDVAVLETIRAVAAGTFQGGIRELGLEERALDYIDDEHNAKWITEDVRARVEELRRRVIAKEIAVPWR